MNSLYAIMEVDGNGDEKFFNGLLQSGNYNKSYKLSVFKYEKTADNRLTDIQNEYQRFIDEENPRWRRDFRIVGELYIKEFTA